MILDAATAATMHIAIPERISVARIFEKEFTSFTTLPSIGILDAQSLDSRPGSEE